MINNEFTVSVQNGSNKIVGSSEEKFAGISIDSLIKIQDNNDLYTIVSKDKSFFIKEFGSIDSKIIVINDNLLHRLQIGDYLSITYKEYEILGILDIIDSGYSYLEDEELIINGGIVNTDILTGNSFPAIIRVASADASGKVIELSIKDHGCYLQTPPEECFLLSRFSGKNCKVSVRYRQKDTRTVTERKISAINVKDNNTYISLDYSLPPNITNGKISVEKYTLVVDRPFSGQSGSNLTYNIYKDFTPNIGIPLMLRGSLCPEIIFNKAMQRIDEEISALKSQINRK